MWLICRNFCKTHDPAGRPRGTRDRRALSRSSKRPAVATLKRLHAYLKQYPCRPRKLGSGAWFAESPLLRPHRMHRLAAFRVRPCIVAVHLIFTNDFSLRWA